jgi:Ring finger domain
MSCTALTLNGRKCRKIALRDGLCCVHLTQKCTICMEDVKSNNTNSSKRLTCGHAFHTECIMQWFRMSNVCPVCRVEQNGDPLIIFKNAIEEEMRRRYNDAIQSLERQLAQHRRRYRRIIVDEDDEEWRGQ